jgi:hypothetical protein
LNIDASRRFVVPTVTRPDQSGTGSGRSNKASAVLKMAMFAPVPKAIEITAITANPGARPINRSA